MEYISLLRYSSVLEDINFCTGTYSLLAEYKCISVLEHVLLFWNTHFRIRIYISVLELRVLYRKKKIYLCTGIYIVVLEYIYCCIGICIDELEYALLYCPCGPP